MRRLLWSIWGGLTLMAISVFTYILLGEDKSLFIPGRTSDGHHQIESACESCHRYAFGGGPVLQSACLKCHNEELSVAEDSHSRKKFMDPRNTERIATIDATLCATCHKEHRPEMTRAMGVTVPDDFCYHCHKDIDEDRPSHRDLGFDSCAQAGCHNYHDNRALYEDLLLKHANEPDKFKLPVLPDRNYAEIMRAVKNQTVERLSRANHDAPADLPLAEQLIVDWEQTAHAHAGVNCMDCHKPPNAVARHSNWQEKVDQRMCESCHEDEMAGFLAGKHGMRLALELSPMTPAQARQAMKKKNKDKRLTCTVCHPSHRFDTKRAAIDSCLKCHNDEHSKAYKQSPHYDLWKQEIAGESINGTGVSCAGCHLPREVHRYRGKDLIHVQHNQNANLRPNEKMLRGVCMRCHGMRFSLDALADKKLIRANFLGTPSVHVKSIDMAMERAKEQQSGKDR